MTISSAPEERPKSNTLDAKRLALVDRARKGWIDRLIDTSRRNNLLYFRPLKTGTLELDLQHIAEDLLSGRAVPLSDAIGKGDLTRASAIVSEIESRARTNREERGLETLFIALGLASWKADDGGRDPESPILLLPVDLERSGRDRSRVSFRKSGEPQLNLVLLHVLNKELGCAVDSDHVLPELADEEIPDLLAVFARLSNSIQSVPTFRTSARAVLGNFSFQKLAMVRDLQEHEALLAGHDVIAALAGDAQARQAIRPKSADCDRREFDSISPNDEFLVLDADSSQMQAVAHALKGDNVVVQGPPGTGKSQTIANLIAACAAQGKSVLFVAEKKAALDAVKKRLKEVGLEHLALDVHGADVSRKKVMDQLKARMAIVKDAHVVATEPTHSRLTDRRDRLVAHERRMHAPRAPSGRSVFELQATLLSLGTPSPRSRLRGGALDALTAATHRAIEDTFKEARSFESLILGTDASPWSGAVLEDGASAQSCLDAAGMLAASEVRALVGALERYCSATATKPATTLAQARTIVELQAELTDVFQTHSPAIFALDLAGTITALGPADRSFLPRGWTWLTKPSYRQALRSIRATQIHGTSSSRVALNTARRASKLLEAWRALSSIPQPQCEPELARAIAQHLDAVRAHVSRLETATREKLATASFEVIQVRAQELAADARTAMRIPPWRAIEKRLVQFGMGPLMEELREARSPAHTWGKIVDGCLAASLLDRVRVEDPDVAGFSGDTHSGFAAEFQRLDRERIELAARRVRRAHAEQAVAARNAHPEQDRIVSQEMNRTRSRVPLRTLMAKAPDVLTKLSPCWMGSPLSVSHLFGAQSRCFDLVVFDEASQVLPEDAIPAILRGSQVVVAGDRHQLPPTSFFADSSRDEEDEKKETDGEEVVDEAAGFESLLDLMAASSVRASMLLWHYRSKAEALIAFSNAHIYDHRLITFPDVGGDPSVSHVLVDGSKAPSVNPESGSAEVQKVVELVLEHAANRPSETLGVIALGIGHAQRVEAAIRRALRDRPELDEFFDPELHERFFVKNLERVQGDERDSIILTIGLVKDRAGVLLNRLGPLNQEGGARRLNVAVTRARGRMTLVTSFSHHDMDPGRFHAPGAELMRKYVEYAASGGTNLPDAGATSVASNEFESDVQEALASRGIKTLSQWGASSYRLDLVACHPSQHGRFVLAIECDGSSYHSGYTARERDRLRQQHLEALGWKFHRIWSTDWFNRRDTEIERVVQAYDEAVASSEVEEEPQSVDAHPRNAQTSSSTGERWTRNGAHPGVGRRESIGEYLDSELLALARWVRSDGRLRTDDECIGEMFAELGFKRRGPRIVERLKKAAEESRR